MKLEKIFISTSRLKFFQPNNPKERGHLFPDCLSKSSRLLISPAWEVTCPFLNPILWPGIWIFPNGHVWTTCLPPGHSDGLRTSKLRELENLTKENEWAVSRSQRHEFQVDDEKKGCYWPLSRYNSSLCFLFSLKVQRQSWHSITPLEEYFSHQEKSWHFLSPITLRS